MRLVDAPTHPPGVCIVSGKSASDDGFVELGQVPGIDPVAYVTVSVLRELAPQLGLVSADRHEEVVAELARVEQELAEARDELAEAERYKESVEWTLRSVGQKVAGKPGPKPKVEAA